jgi:opacity protein-like surface antigen
VITIKKILSFLLAVLFLMIAVNITMADSNWEFSIEDLNLSGNLDFLAYWGSTDSSQVISKVHMPQNQNMTILSGKYNLPNGGFIKLQYGSTGTNIKGRGSDSDWTTYGSDALTCYGDMDFYGYQRLYSADLGTTINETDAQKITVFLGWGKQESTNEFKNVVYHLYYGKDIGNTAQDDNGTSLKAYFNGARLGMSDDITITPNFSFDLGIIFSIIKANVYGHWANYDPAWDWSSNGTGYGYTADAGLKYSFNDQLAVRLGYHYNYIKIENCSLSDSDQATDYKYNLSGFNFGLSYRF